ncbi:hypothetical protein [Lysinibacillus sp. NPDC047702]|uniref:hypothetical protein n=1 Tax=unclassified Lysinibacillus TaxID=2636778 RepID=UPI003D06CE60
MKKTLIIISIVLLILLTACNSSSKVVDDFDNSQLSVDFDDDEAYEIEANAKGMPVFKNHKKALQQAQIDYKKGFAATAKEHDLKPISQENYKDYMTYAWQLETKDETVVQQGVMIAKFLDIYENSFE